MRAFIFAFFLSGFLYGENHRPKTVIFDFEKEDRAQGGQSLREIPIQKEDNDSMEAQSRYLNRVEAVYLFEIPE